MKKKIFIIIILIILVLVGVLFLIINHKKEYVITPKHNNITSIELSMKELYKQRVIDNSLKYLDKNGINLLNNFIIDTNSIVKSNKCTGTTQFKLGKDMYKQSVDIKCLDDSDTSSSEFSSYLFDAKKKSPIDLTDVDDGYLLISDINIITETDENGYVDTKDNDINISKYDKSFNLLWTYNYLGKEENYLDEEDLEEEDKFFATSIDYMKEYNNKFFFLINISNSSDTGSTRLLIINNDGSVYKDFRFDDYMDNIVSIDGNIVTFSYYDYIYKYNYETDELIDYTMKTSEEGEKTVLDKVDDGYLMFSTINNYTDEDEDGNNIDVEEGTNSLYLLDKELKVKKSLNLDKAIGISINNFDIDYNDIKVIDNKVYISYNTNKFYIKDGITTMEYPGILIVDMNLNKSKKTFL